MERQYNNQEHNVDTNFFVGTEVEHTNHYGKKTLFVVGVQSPSTIAQMATNAAAEHIYFGANKSWPTFAGLASEDEVTSILNEWIFMLNDPALAKYDKTLDFPFYHRIFADRLRKQMHSDVTYLISYPMENISPWLANFDTYIKIDDIGMNTTNPGVWVHSLNELCNVDNLTKWSEYKDDKVIK
jgi:hypothetical protein